jgi:hypothetical protein
MRFICILLLFICCHGYASEKEIFPDGNGNKFQLSVSNHNQPDADQPTTPRSSIAIMRYSLVKKIAAVSTTPGPVTTQSYIKSVPVSVIADAGIHVKDYLRHIYPAMHYW